MADGRKNNGSKPGERRGGRQKGTPNKDKKELRDAVTEAVRDFTTLRRQQDLDNDISPADAQPIIEDYCPVTELALAGADYRNKPELRLQANANAAKFLRPTLKAIEVTNDPDENDSRRELSAVLAEMIIGRSKPTQDEEAVTYERGTNDTK